MKLVSKECPNCGAKLSFDENDTRVVCKYCKQTSVIQKEEPKDKYYENYEQDGNCSSYTLYIEKNYDSLEEMEDLINDGKMKPETKETILRTSQIVHPSFFSWKTFIIILVYVFICLIYCVSKNKDFNETFRKEQVSTESYIKTISQIDGKSLYTLKNNSQNALNAWKDNLPAPSRSGAWEYVGMYLLVSKETFKDNNSVVYIICKKENEVKRKNYTYYGVSAYDDLVLSDSGLEVSSEVRPLIILPKSSFEKDSYRYVYGYGSLKDLYNQVVKTKIDMYDVFATTGMYVE